MEDTLMSTALENLLRKLTEQKSVILSGIICALADARDGAAGDEEMQDFTAHVVDEFFSHIGSSRKAAVDSLGAKFESLPWTNTAALGEFQKILYHAILKNLSIDEKCLIMDKFLDFSAQISVGFNKSFAATMKSDLDQAYQVRRKEIHNAGKEIEVLHAQIDSPAATRTRELSEKNKELAKEIRELQHADRVQRAQVARYRTLAEKYHSIFDKIHNAIFLIENEIVIESNCATMQFFGEPPQAVNGNSLVSMLGKSERRDINFVKQLRRKIELCLEGKPQQLKVQYARSDGVHMQLEIHLTHFPEGGDSQLLAVVRNITPYNQAIEALKTSEKRFKDIIDRSLDGYYFVDADYKLQALNKAAQKITTFSIDEINSSLRSAPQDERSKAMLKMIKTAKGGASLSWEELEFTDREGNKRWIALNARRVYSGGVVSGVEGFIKDITVRKAAQVQLAESVARYRAIFNNTPYDVFGLTIDKKFVKVNPKFVDSWGRLEGKTLEALRPKSLSGVISGLCDDVQIKGASVEKSYYYKFKSKYFRIIIAPNMTEEKEILGYAGLIIDVTEASNSLQEKMKFAEALIRSSEDEQRRISREIHDSLGQMLFALQIDLSSIKAKLSKDEPENGVLFENAERILTKSMQEASNMCHRLHPRLLDDFGLQEALADLVANIEKSGRLEIEFDAQIKTKIRNKNVETAIYRVVQEALANVLKHSRATQANLKVRSNQDGITLLIKDNGAGFNLAEIQAKKKRGFGLLNMKERVEMIGGSLKIKTARGQGVSIDIIVPN